MRRLCVCVLLLHILCEGSKLHKDCLQSRHSALVVALLLFAVLQSRDCVLAVASLLQKLPRKHSVALGQSRVSPLELEKHTEPGEILRVDPPPPPTLQIRFPPFFLLQPGR